MTTKTIVLYTTPTPNCFKISTVLEELGLSYEVRSVDLTTQEQKEEWFLKINPNGRLPAITDGSTRVFESGAIMLYLVDRYDTERKISYAPDDLPGYTEQLGWLFWQIGGLGPMQGQAHHFNFMAPVRSDWGIERYNQETRRLYSVLNTRLQSSHFLAGEKFTIADIASVFWVRISVKLLGWDLAEWPAVQQWHDGIMQRDMVRRAMKVPSPKIPEDAFLKMMAVKREALMAKANSDLK